MRNQKFIDAQSALIRARETIEALELTEDQNVAIQEREEFEGFLDSAVWSLARLESFTEM